MSDVDQAEEQSMEDILSSIRKIISDDPEADSAAARIAGSLAQNGHSASATPLTGNHANAAPGVFPGRLSDALGRVARTDATQTNSFTSSDDDLSDLLDDPLPAPHSPFSNESSTPFSNLGQTDAIDETPAGADAGQKDTEPGFGSFIPIRNTSNQPDPEPVVIATSKASAEAALKKARSEEKAEGSDAESTSVDLGATATPAALESTNTSLSTDDIPRSMSALSSGIAMPENIDPAPASTPGSIDDSSTTNASETPAPFLTSTAAPSIDGLAARLSNHSLDASPEDSKSVSDNLELTVGGASEPASSKPASSVSVPDMSAPPVSVAVSPIAAADGLAPDALQARESIGAIATETQKSLEDTVSEMIRPMLYAWLEANLPRIVENALRIEMQERTGPDKADPTNP